MVMSAGVSPPCVFLSAGLEDDVGCFDIDMKTGDIRTTQLFTHNAEAYYTLKITAKDSGTTPQEDTSVVHVQVQDDFKIKANELYICFFTVIGVRFGFVPRISCMVES